LKQQQSTGSRARLSWSSFSCLKSISSYEQIHTAEATGTHHHQETYFAVAKWQGQGEEHGNDEQVLGKQL